MEANKDKRTSKILISSLVVVGVALFFSVFFVLPKLLSGPKEDVVVKSLDDFEANFSDFLLDTALKVNEVERKIKKNFGDEVTFEDLKETPINGISALEFIKDSVSGNLNRNLFVRDAAKKLNIVLTPEEMNGIKSQAYQTFKNLNVSFNAKDIGISLDSCCRAYEINMLEQKISEELFGEGKSKEIKEDEIKKFAEDKDKFARYQIIKLPEFLENVKVKDCKEDVLNKKDEEKKDEKKKDEEKKDEKDGEELVIEKSFGVKTVKELRDKIFDEIKSKKKTWEDIVDELKKAFKSNIYIPKEQNMYLYDEEEDEESRANKDPEMKNLKDNMKTMNGEDVRKIDYEEEISLIRKYSIDEKILEKEKESIKTKLEGDIKKQFFEEIEKENIDKIQTNEDILTLDNVKKQVKKVYKYKKKEESFF